MSPADPIAGPQDRYRRATILAGLEALTGPLPDELLASIETIGECFDWWLSRTPADVDVPKSRLVHGLPGHRIRLRPLRPADLPRIYDSVVGSAASHHWRYRGSTPSFQEFELDLFGGVLCQFAVASAESDEVLGIVVAYQAALEHGRCYIAMTRVAQPSEPIGEMFGGAFLFLEHLFKTWNLRKVYAEIPGFNWDYFANAENEIFRVEGTLRGHDFYDGKFWDLRIVSIDAGTWKESIEPRWAGVF